MSVIEKLLITQQRECEEQRSFIAELANLAERFRADALRLHREREKAKDAGPAIGGGIAAGPASLTLRLRVLEASIAEIDSRVEAARAALAAAEEQIRRRESARRDRRGPAADGSRGVRQ